MNGVVCVGKKGKNYVYISYNIDMLKSFISSDILDLSFNEKKYEDLKKGRRTVLTVIGEVTNNWDNHLGYIVSDHNGSLELLTDSQFEKYLKNLPCMNYSLVVKDSTSYIRRNPKTVVEIFDDNLIKSLFGFSFEDYKLRNDMTLDELDFCMRNNGFILGFSEKVETEYYSHIKELNHLIYYNSEGSIIVFNHINNTLNYFYSSCILMRHVDNNKFYNFVKKNPYATGSTSPVDGVNTDVLVMSSQEKFKFLTMVKTAKQYSKPCKPFYISENLDGAYNILILNPVDIKIIKNKCEGLSKRYGVDDFVVNIISEEYVAYKKIFKYNQGLQKLYENYISKFLPLLQKKAQRLGLSERDYKDLLIFLDKLF